MYDIYFLASNKDRGAICIAIHDSTRPWMPNSMGTTWVKPDAGSSLCEVHGFSYHADGLA